MKDVKLTLLASHISILNWPQRCKCEFIYLLQYNIICLFSSISESWSSAENNGKQTLKCTSWLGYNWLHLCIYFKWTYSIENTDSDWNSLTFCCFCCWLCFNILRADVYCVPLALSLPLYKAATPACLIKHKHEFAAPSLIKFLSLYANLPLDILIDCYY